MTEWLDNPNRFRDAAAALGRAFIAAIFLASGFSKITHFSATVRLMAGQGIVAAPLLAASSAAIEILGGLSLLLGYRARPAAAVLAAWLVPVTWIFHLAAGQWIQVLKNAAIIGGLLQVFALGPGRCSFDGQ